MQIAMRILALALCGGVMALNAGADPAKLAPPGWSAQFDRSTKAWNYKSPDGRGEGRAHMNTVQDAERLSETATRHMKPYRTEAIGVQGPSPAGSGGLLTVGAYQSRDDATRYVASSAVIPHRLGGHLVCRMSAPLAGDRPPESISDFLSACDMFASSGEPFDPQQATTAAQRSEVAASGIKAGKGRPVETLLFDLTYISGVGGAVLPDYRPVVLFRDGTACRCLDLPLADIDVSEIVRDRPDHVTRWQKQGSNYVFTWPGDREATSIEPARKKPVTFKAGHKLNGYWQRIGGGGNTAMGGSTMVAASRGYQFNPNGTFSTERSAGGSAPGVAVARRSGEAGRYEIGRDGLLTLTFPDGRTLRTSLVHQQGATDTLWIGGVAYTD